MELKLLIKTSIVWSFEIIGMEKLKISLGDEIFIKLLTCKLNILILQNNVSKQLRKYYSLFLKPQ